MLLLSLPGERPESFSHIIWKVDLRKTPSYRVTNNPHIMRVPEFGTYLMTHPHIRD
jgi:hypothetical protein